MEIVVNFYRNRLLYAPSDPPYNKLSVTLDKQPHIIVPTVTLYPMDAVLYLLVLEWPRIYSRPGVDISPSFIVMIVCHCLTFNGLHFIRALGTTSVFLFSLGL